MEWSSVLLKAIYVAYYSSGGSVGVFLPVYFGEALDLSPTRIGILYIILPFVRMVISPVVGVIADLGRPKLIFFVCVLLNAAALTGMYFLSWAGVPKPSWLFGAACACIFFRSLFNAPGVSVLDGIAIGMQGRKSYARNRLFGAGGYGAGALGAGLIVRFASASWLWHFVLAGASLAVSLMLVLFLPSEKKVKTMEERPLVMNDAAEEMDPPKRTFREKLRLIEWSGHMFAYMGIVMVCGIAMGMVNTYLLLYLSFLNGSQLLQGASVAVTTLFEMGFFFISPQLLARYSSEQITILSLAGFCLRFVFYYGLSLMSFPGSPWLVLIAESLHGFCFALMFASAQDFAQEKVEKIPGLVQTMSGILMGLLQGGQGIAAFGGPIITRYGYGSLWLGLGGAYGAICLGWLAYVIMQPKAKRKHETSK